MVDEPTTGVWAWTTGTQTYLRVRPGAQTPAVAKVPRRTKMFVWGKYNGWYRVETVDHKFGWVYHDWLNCPKSAKIATLSHRKAVLASNRASGQTLYGTPTQLKTYYSRHGSSGAVRGLAKQGIRIAASPKPKTSTASKARSIAQTAPRPAKSVVAKALPAVITPRRKAQVAKVTKTAPARVAAVRVDESVWRNGTALAPRHPALARFITPGDRPQFETERDESTRSSRTPRSVFKRVFAPTPNADAPAYERSTVVQPPIAQTRDSSQQDSLEISEEMAPIASDAIPVAVVARPVAARKAAVKPVVKTVAAPKKAAAKSAAPTRVATKKVVKPAAKAPVKVAQKPKPTRSQLRAQARLARAQAQAKQRQMRLASRRGQIRARMGMPRMVVPPMAVKGIKPISPEELMRAREQFLSSRRKPAADLVTSQGVLRGDEQGNSQGVSAYPGGVQGSISSNPNFDSGRDLPASIQPSAWNSESQNANDSAWPALSSRSQSFDAHAYYMASAKKVAAKKPVVVNRGGSPRDYYRGSKVAPGQAMANQALTYRGMPYIRGAASPSRGFDCSGLVYYLLRQRGYNPPRTAAGLAGFGAPVARGDLQSGDIILFANTYKRGVSHVGVYMGQGKFVHAARSGVPVKVDSLNSSYYAKKYHSARRAK